MVDTLALTRTELDDLIHELSEVFDIVRTVDATLQKAVVYTPDGKVYETEHSCYDAWNKDGRCNNCVSAMAFRDKTRLSKFEFIGPEVFHVVSQYIEVDGDPALLEIVSKENNEVLFGTIGKARLVQKLQQFAEQSYTDPLTKANNRRYWDEQVGNLMIDAVAMIDVDYFKQVNDTFGHECGDLALQAVAQAIKSSIRRDDTLIRYGGDEFTVAYVGMQPQFLYDRLESIRKRVEGIVIEGHEDIKLTISIGGAAGKTPAKELMRHADEALYESKKTRNRVTVYDE